MRTIWPEPWVRADQYEYELTEKWGRIDQMSTNWPIDKYELAKLRTDLSMSWLKNELTGNLYISCQSISI